MNLREPRKRTLSDLGRWVSTGRAGVLLNVEGSSAYIFSIVNPLSNQIQSQYWLQDLRSVLTATSAQSVRLVMALSEAGSSLRWKIVSNFDIEVAWAPL